MSPEFKESWSSKSEDKLMGEKNDVFSLGVTLLQDHLTLKNDEIRGINEKGGEQIINRLLGLVEDDQIRKILRGMLLHSPSERWGYFEVIDVCYNL